MLKIQIPAAELYDPSTETFINVKKQTLTLEHSLLSISKWESKWHKPFISKEQKTLEETRDYVRCMTLSQHDVDPLVYQYLPASVYEEIEKYTNEPMTATWFSDDKRPKRPSREVITAEIIYYWMVTLGIPFECQKWHLNRLLTLIRVCNEKNAPAKKMSQRELMARNRSLNAQRRQARHTRG